MTKRIFSDNARIVLAPFEDQLVHCRARLKEYRDHPSRDDLRSAVFVPAIITPEMSRDSITLHHLWVLQRHLKTADVTLHKGRWVEFVGTVYAYKRLGGKSEERGLKGQWDFGVLPVYQYNLDQT
jgi:hypothetical protein